MAKPELGTKRLCPSCGAKYYDLNRNPITCPKCGTLFEVVLTSRAAKAAKAEVKPVEPEAEEEEDLAAPEIVTLEEADAEAEGTEDVPDLADDDVALEDDEADDDVFLEDEDEDDDAVPGLVVEIEDETET